MIRYRWATLGCGVIAHQLAEAMKAQGATLYSVANRTKAKAEQFAAQYGIEKVYDTIEEVFEDEKLINKKQKEKEIQEKNEKNQKRETMKGSSGTVLNLKEDSSSKDEEEDE